MDAATNTVIQRIKVDAGPRSMVMSPDGTKLFVANEFGETVTVINTATNAIAASYACRSGTRRPAVNPTDARVYVAASDNDTVSVIPGNRIPALPVFGSVGEWVLPDGGGVQS